MSWTAQPVAAFTLILLAVAYSQGARTLRGQGRGPGPAQVIAFGLGATLVAAATLSPLVDLRHEYLFARSLQQVLVSIAAPPLLWYGGIGSCLGAALPRFSALQRWRQRPLIVSILSLLRTVANPGVAWAAALSLFALWHDPFVLAWLNSVQWRANAGLWIYGGVYMIFWWHALAAEPRWHKPLPVWIRFLYLIVGGEAANMLTGVSLAFRSFPLYPYYAADPAPLLSPLRDQMISGAIIWVTGSFFYIFVAVAVVGQHLFRNARPRAVPPREWRKATRRTIAPGLEDRVG